MNSNVNTCTPGSAHDQILGRRLPAAIGTIAATNEQSQDGKAAPAARSFENLASKPRCLMPSLGFLQGVFDLPSIAELECCNLALCPATTAAGRHAARAQYLCCLRTCAPSCAASSQAGRRLTCQAPYRLRERPSPTHCGRGADEAQEFRAAPPSLPKPARTNAAIHHAIDVEHRDRQTSAQEAVSDRRCHPVLEMFFGDWNNCRKRFDLSDAQ